LEWTERTAHHLRCTRRLSTSPESTNALTQFGVISLAFDYMQARS
jgi:hypothetical protein